MRFYQPHGQTLYSYVAHRKGGGGGGGGGNHPLLVLLTAWPFLLQMQDIAEREQEEELRRKYTRASAEQENTKREENAIGFKIRDAPWSEGKEDFPVLGDGNAPPKKSQWGVGAIWSGAKAGPK